jgi:hypothetical protein
MPRFNAFADVFRRWDKMLGACELNAALLPGVDELKAELQAHRIRLQELKEQQEHLGSHRQSMTQRVLQARDAGQEAWRKLRAFVLTRIGTREELLTDFGIRPNRARKTPRVKPGEEPAAPVSPPVEVVGKALVKAGVQPQVKATPAETAAQPPEPPAEPPAEPSTNITQKEEQK